MEAEKQTELSDLIRRAQTLESVLMNIPTTMHEQSERVDSLQQSPSHEGFELSKFSPAPSEGEWIAGSLPCPRTNAPSIQRRCDKMTRDLSPLLFDVENYETTSDKETPPPLPPRPTTTSERKTQPVPRNEHSEKLHTLVDFRDKISKVAKKLRRKLAKVFGGRLHSRSDKKGNRRDEQRNALLSTRTNGGGDTIEVCDDLSPLPTRQQRRNRNTKGIYLAPGTYNHEVVIFNKRKARMAKTRGRRRRRKLPIVVVTFEDGWEGWRYVQRCRFRRDIELVGIRVRRVFG